MAFVDVAVAVGTAVGWEGIGAGAAGVLGGSLMGAGAGALYSGVTGDGNILNSALTGATIGGAVGGVGGAYQAANPSTVGNLTSNVVTPTSAQLTGANTAIGAQLANASADPILAASNLSGMSASEIAAANAPAGGAGLSGNKMLGYGLAGTAALSLLGSPKKPGVVSSSNADTGEIRPYTYSSKLNPNYGLPGEPYYVQSYTPGTPYKAARGGIMHYAIGGGVGNMFPQSQQEHTNFATPTQMPTSAEVVNADYDQVTNPYTGNMPRFADGGMARFSAGGQDDDDEDRLRKIVMRNLKGSTGEDLRMAMDSMDEQKFLMKNMPNYAASMSPSLSGMIEGSQYGDRMSRSYGDLAKANALKSGQDYIEPSSNYVRFQPTNANLQDKTYGGIASIGRQLDDDTRINLMAALQRTPYDKNALDAVRRIGGGVSRKLDKDTDLSAFYEQDPMGKSKSGGVRYTQRFADGGQTGLPPMPGQFVPQVDVQQMPAAVNTYTQAPTPVPQAVTDYNKLLAARANEEYVKALPPVSMMPGGKYGTADITNQITQNYQDLLGRAPEQAGLDYWVKQAQSGTKLSDIKNAIGSSPEYYKAHPEDISPAVSNAYKSILGRSADQPGLDYWTNQIKGGMSLGDVQNAMKASSEYATANPVTPAATGPSQADINAYLAANPTTTRSYDPVTQTFGAPKVTQAMIDDWKAKSSQTAETMDPAILEQMYNDYKRRMQPETGAAGGIMHGYASGGLPQYNLGSYSDGGRLLKGPGDGMSDNIPATIAQKQPARLADGEFVVPADVVSHLGNGSTDAGAKRLYSMMDNVRKARTGSKKQGKQIKADKFLPT